MRIASPITILSGFITSRIVQCVRSRRISFIAIRFCDSRSMSANTAWLGQRDVQQRARDRPRGGQDLPLEGKDLVDPPAGDVGKRQQPQRLAGRRAVDDDDVPLAGFVVGLEPQEREELVAAGRHGQLLGRDPVHAALDEQLAQPLLHSGPMAFHLVLGLDLLAPQVVAGLDRLGAQLGAERLREAVGRVGGDDQRPQAPPPRSRGRCRRPPRSCRRRPFRYRGSSAGAPSARVYAARTPARRRERARPLSA